jgi:nitrile hydratase
VEEETPVPDALAHGRNAVEPVYNVRFDASELWGEDAEGGFVHLDLWERYLEAPAENGRSTVDHA